MPESTEESSLLLKIQKFENKIPGEKLESPKIERGKSLDIFLYGTPIRKRRDIECISKKSNRLLSTPKKYFGEDILNSVPRNIGRFKNYTNGFSIDGCINTNTDDILHGIILKKNEIEVKYSIRDNPNDERLKFFSKSTCSANFDSKNIKNWYEEILCITYDILIYHLPCALVVYSFSLYLLGSL